MKLTLACCWTTLVMAAVLPRWSEAFQLVRPSTRLSSTRKRYESSSSSSSSSLHAYVDVREAVERDIGTMDEWASACGVQRAGGFQLTTEDGQDWSVLSTENVAAQTPILFVPAELILSSNRVQAELGQALQPAVDFLGRLGAQDSNASFMLFVKLLTMYEMGDQSPWYPWLNSLPRLYYNAPSMTSFCYECLPPLVFSYSRGERVKYDNFVQALDKVDILSEQTKRNEAVTKWAFNVVLTRAFGSEQEGKNIVPMADMFNHGTETQVDMAFDEEGNCNVYTTTDVAAGSPLRMSYGCPTNPSKLFAVYGFLDESSPATFCKMTNIQANQELLDLGYDFSRMVFYKETGDVSQEVWDILLYLHLANNRDDRQAFYEAHMRGDEDTKNAMHQHYFPETAAALKKHVDTFLKALDELSEKAVGKDLNEHPRLPLILRHNEFVRETFLTVKSRLDPMVAEAQPEYV